MSQVDFMSSNLFTPYNLMQTHLYLFYVYDAFELLEWSAGCEPYPDSELAMRSKI